MKRTLCALALSIVAGMILPNRDVRAARSDAGTGRPGRAVAAQAIAFLGYPYVRGGCAPGRGFSPTGLVTYVYSQFNIRIPSDPVAAMRAYPHVAATRVGAGDVLFFHGSGPGAPDGAGVAIGGGWFVHADDALHGVTLSRLYGDPRQGNYWSNHFLLAVRPLALHVGGRRAPAAQTHTGTRSHAGSVVAARLNIRRFPSLAAPILTIVPKGTAVHVVGARAGWLHVHLRTGLSGWVVRFAVRVPRVPRVTAGVATVKTPARPPTSSRSAAAYPHRSGRQAVGHAVSASAGVNVHAAPGLTAPVIAVTDGRPLRVIGERRAWAHVALNTRRQGWMLARFITPALRSARPAAVRRAAATRTAWVVPGVRVHSAPSLVAAVVATTRMAKVTVTGYDVGFAHVVWRLSPGRVVSGWVLVRFLRSAPPRASGVRRVALRPSASTPGVTRGTVHLRAGPSLAAVVLGWVQVNTRVTVLASSHGWDYVRVADGRVGYLAAYFVRPVTRSTPVSTPTSVAVSASTPAPVPAGSASYVVAPGDTLIGIALRFGVSPSSLALANRLSASAIIRVGERLVIPESYQPLTVRGLISAAAARFGVNPALALAIGWQESGFNQAVISRTGAIGVMQVEPYTGRLIERLLGRPLNLSNVQDNVTAGVFWISYLLRQYGGSEEMAIAAYYEGQENLARHGLLPRTRASIGAGQYVSDVLQLQAYFATH